MIESYSILTERSLSSLNRTCKSRSSRDATQPIKSVHSSEWHSGAKMRENREREEQKPEKETAQMWLLIKNEQTLECSFFSDSDQVFLVFQDHGDY